MSKQDATESVARSIPDVFRFAGEDGVLEGETPVAGFVRLADQLTCDEGWLRWRLLGEAGDEGEPRLVLDVGGRLTLRCQCCLGSLDHELAIRAVLRPVRAGQALPEDELDDDEADAIEIDGEVDVLSLVEDEIILALPMAPRHEDCGAARSSKKASATAYDGNSPFAVLADLRGG
jgi:uncharacterized protein